MKPVIVLDVDGVLNTPDTWCNHPLETEAIDVDKVERLSNLAEQLEAKGFECQLIQTDFMVGLTDRDCSKAREAIEKQRGEPA